MGPKKRPREDKPESRSPKKAQTTEPEVEKKTVHLTDKDGRAAYKVSGERWTTESGVPGVTVEGSPRPNTKELLEDMVRVGEEQIGLMRETVELLKELKGGIQGLDRVLRGSKVRWAAAGDQDGEEELDTLEDD
jgi:hypothetical protein